MFSVRTRVFAALAGHSFSLIACEANLVLLVLVLAYVNRGSSPCPHRVSVRTMAKGRAPYGPWTGPGVDAEFAAAQRVAPGDVIEHACYDGEGASQGTAVLQIWEVSGRQFHAHVHAASDGYYEWWLSNEAPNPGWYVLADSADQEAETAVGDATYYTIYEWRVLNPTGFAPDLSAVSWLQASQRRRLGRAMAKVIEDRAGLSAPGTDLSSAEVGRTPDGNRPGGGRAGSP